MDWQDFKLAVIYQLSQESEPVSLSDLLRKMENKYAGRSVRRWLSEMVSEGLVEKHGQNRGTKYRVAPLAHRGTSCTSFGMNSVNIIQQVRQPLFTREPITYVETWLNSYQPNVTSYISNNLKDKLFQAGKGCQKEDPAGTYAHQIFNRLLIDLSYNSSRLEGNTYSLLDTEKLILEGRGADNKLDDEKIMILNHKEAIRFLVDGAPRLRITEDTIYTLHYLLSDGLLEPRYSGKARDHAVRISGSVYIPLEDQRSLQRLLKLIVDKAASINDPYEQSFFLLTHTSYLQAFSDVNKRTARLCSNIPLIKNNLVPLAFNDIERDDYNSALIAIYELQDPRPFLDIYVFSYMRTCAMYESTVKIVGFDEIRVRYRQQRRDLLREIVTKNIVGPELSEYVTTKTVQLVKENERVSFIGDLKEDLAEIDSTRIYGLGITLDQLNYWLRMNPNKDPF